MTDNEYIKKAVELAPDVWPWDYQKITPDAELNQVYLDALAAQLVRQVDACGKSVDVQGRWAAVVDWPGGDIVDYAEGPDRTMNTIKVIVDSRVLK